jgi:hypothetical protein
MYWFCFVLFSLIIDILLNCIALFSLLYFCCCMYRFQSTRMQCHPSFQGVLALFPSSSAAISDPSRPIMIFTVTTSSFGCATILYALLLISNHNQYVTSTIRTTNHCYSILFRYDCNVSKRSRKDRFTTLPLKTMQIFSVKLQQAQHAFNTANCDKNQRTKHSQLEDVPPLPSEPQSPTKIQTHALLQQLGAVFHRRPCYVPGLLAG